MAVAVQTTESKPKASASTSLVIASLIGAAFVMFAGWLVLRGVPWLWEHGVGSAIANSTNAFVSVAAQILTLAAIAIGLIYLAARFGKGQGPPGVRGGIFFVIVSAFLAFFSLKGLYQVATQPFSFGSVIVMLFWVLLLFLIVQFFRKGHFVEWSVAVDHGGWFHAQTHKRTQGLRVRRLTILGLLLIAGTGIYTLVSHNYLPANATVRVPEAAIDPDGKPTIKYREQSNRLGDWVIGGTTVQPGKILESMPEEQREFTRLQNRAAPRVEGGLTLLPDLQFTIPLILIGATLWLAWRLVNYPTFADFLIATEAEINKVSWSSRRALFRDTIVVLTSLLLLTVFLFVVDVFWGWLLSQSWVGVLPTEGEIPPPQEAKPVKDW